MSLTSLWEDTWDNISDFGSDLDDFVFHGGFEDDLRDTGRWFDDEVWEPVYDFQKDIVNGILEDPIKFVSEAILVATGQGWAIPLMNAAAVADAGGDWKDVLEAAAVGYAAQYIGTKTAGFVDDAFTDYVPEQYYNDTVATALIEGTERGTNALVLGESATDAFTNGVLTIGTEHLAGIALGEIDDLIGLTFENAEGVTLPLPQAVINIVSAGVTAELQGKEITPALYAEAVSKAIVTTEAVSNVINKIPGVTDGSISDKQLSFLTTSIQRTATVALAGGTGGDAARVLKETLQGFASQELTTAIQDSLLGDVLDNALGVLTGDFSKVSDTIDSLGALWTGSIEGLQNQAVEISNNIDDYGEKYNRALEEYASDPAFDNIPLKTIYDNAEENWEFVSKGDGTFDLVLSETPTDMNFSEALFAGNKYNMGFQNTNGYYNENELAELAGGLTQNQLESISDYAGNVSANINASFKTYDDYITANAGTLSGLNAELAPLYDQWEVLNTTLQTDMAALETSSKEVDTQMGGVNASVNKVFTEAMDANFDPVEYAEINELPANTDPYTHYLTTGSKEGLATNNAAKDAAGKARDNTAASNLLAEIITYAETPSNNATVAFSKTYQDILNGDIRKDGKVVANPEELLKDLLAANAFNKLSEEEQKEFLANKSALASDVSGAVDARLQELEDNPQFYNPDLRLAFTNPATANRGVFKNPTYTDAWALARKYFDSSQISLNVKTRAQLYTEFTEENGRAPTYYEQTLLSDTLGGSGFNSSAPSIPKVDTRDLSEADRAAFWAEYRQLITRNEVYTVSTSPRSRSWGGNTDINALYDNWGEYLGYDDFDRATYRDTTLTQEAKDAVYDDFISSASGQDVAEAKETFVLGTVDEEYRDVDVTALVDVANTDYSGVKTTLASGTTWPDVIAGNAVKEYNSSTEKFEWVVIPETEAPITIWDADKGLIPINKGTDFVTLRSEDPLDFLDNLVEMNEVIVTAERAAIVDDLQRNGMAGFIDMAVWMGTKREELKQDVLDAIPGSQARKDRFEDDVANIVEWGSGLVNTVNGIQRFIGMDVNPEVTAWAEKWQGLGAEMHTQGYKDARAENDALMAAPIPEGMGNAEGTARKILGTLENRPSVFLMDMVGGEVFQEGLPWLVGAGAVALASPLVGVAGLSAAAGAALLAGIGVTVGVGTEVLVAMSETFDGAYDQVYNESFKELSKQTYTTYVDDEPIEVPLYQPNEIEAMSKMMADDLAFKNSLTAGILTTISMGFGGAKLEKFLFGDKGNATFNNATEELMDRVDNGVDVIIGEVVSETAEEVLTTSHLGSLIVANVNQDYDVAPDVWMAAFLSPIITTGTVSTIYTLGQGPLADYNNKVSYDPDGVTQGDGFSMRDSFNGTTTNMSADPSTHLLLNSSPQVNWAFNNTPKTPAGAQQLELFLDDVGVTGTTAVNLLNEVDDANYNSSAEVVEEFAKSGYTPSFDEITQFTAANDPNTLFADDITTYVEPFVVTAQDLVDAAAGKGITLTLDQASEMKPYLGQYVEDTKQAAIATRAEPVADLAVLDAGEVSELFQANGWTKEQADNYVAANPNVAASVAGMTESEVQNLYGSLINAEVVTREEAEAFYAKHYPGYAFTPEDIDAIVTGANVTWDGSAGESAAIQTIKDQKYNSAENTQARAAERLAAQKTASLAELDGILSDKDSDIYNQYVTNINNASAGDSLLNLTSLRNDAGRFELTQQELEDALHDQLGIARDTTGAEWVGGKLKYRVIDNGMDAAVAAALASGITVGTNPTAKGDLLGGYTTGVKRDTTESAFGDYNPSEQEITDFLNNNAGIGNYVDANTVTEAEVKRALEAAGFTIPANFDYSAFTGKKPESGLDAATESWRNENTVTEAEVQSALEAAGFTIPANFDYTPFTGKNKADSEINNATKSWQDANTITEAEVESALLAEGFTVPADFDYTPFTGKNKADSGLEATAKTYADNNTVTEAEVRKSLIDQGFTVPTDFDYTPFVGQKPESGLNNATKSWRDANTVTEAEVKSALEADGFTVPADFDYTPFTGKYDQTGLSAKTANWREANTITEAEVKARLAIQGFNVPADFDYSAFTGKKPESGLDAATESWRNENTTTEAEAIASLQGQGYVIPEGFDVTQFTGKNKDRADLATEVYQYLSPLQYTRGDAEAALATELGRALTADDLVTYENYLDGMVDMTGARTNAQGDLQVQEQITNAADVKSYLDGLDYDTSGLTNEDLLAFAGTGLDIDLNADTAGYQAANETITQRDARLAAEAAAAAELAAKTTAINEAMDDASQDGGAYSGEAYDGIRGYYLYNAAGKAQYDALNTEQRKALVQRAVDNRRYSESEIAADIITAFPADADLSVEDLKTKYGTLFTSLQTEGNFGHEDRQRIAFDEGTVTGDEANDYFRDVLGYEGWIPTGNIDSRLVGAGDEATVLPTDIANLTGKTLDLYNETTITQDEVIGAMIANPAGFGFADAAAVAEAVSNGLDLSAYTGNYWQSGAEGSAGDTGKSLAARLDDATTSQDEIDAYLAQEGFDPADAGTFDGNLGFDTTSLADITAGYRGDVETERAADLAAEVELQRQTDAIDAALDDATQDGGAYTPGNRQGFIDWFVNNKNFEGKTAEEIKATIYDDIDNKRYTRSEVADDLRTAFPADAGLSIEDLEAKYAGAFDLVKTGAYATDGEQRTAFGAATTTETEARDALEATGFVIPDGFDFTNLIGVMDATQLGTQISTDLAPLQYTRADAEAALVAELGRPLTAEDLTTYKDYLDGLVDMTGARTDVQGNTKIQDEVTSEQEVRDYLSDYTLGEDFSFDGLTGLDVDLDTELGEFKADNRTTAQNQIAADLNTKGWADASDDDVAAVQGLDSAGRDAWVAERQFTEDQAIAALAAQGITADHPQFESLITQLVVDKGAAGTPTTQGALVDDPEDDLIDRYIITQDEIDTATGGYSYFDFTQTPLGIEPGVADDTTLAGLVQTHVGDNYVQADAAREALNGIAGVDAYEQDGDGAYVITDDQLVGMGLAGQYDPTTLGSKVDAATTTEEEVRAAFGENYDPTDAEIARYMGLLPDGDLGTDIPAYVAGRMDTLVSEVGDLALTVSQLEAQLNGALAEGGSLDQAVSKVADDLGIAEEALLKLIGDNSDKFDDLETAFGTQATDDQEATGIWANIAGLEDDVSDLQDAFGTQGVVDDPDTLDIDESSPATGVYGIIDQIANGSLDNEDAIAALEAVIGEPATYAEDGTTVLTPATGVYAQSGEGVNADVLEAINAVYAYVGNMDTVGSAELEAIGAIVGKPAQEVTQEDIDAVTSLVQGTAVDPETGIVSLYDAKYDVNNDGVVDTRDQDLLTAVQEGDYSVYGGELATDSLFSNTGFYDIFDETRYDTEIQRKQDQDIQNDINEEINNNINTNTNIFLDAQKKAEEEADKQEYARLMQQVQAMSQVSVETPQELANIEYMYDVYGNSPFANDQQRGLYQSPYARAKQDEMATQQQLPLRAAAEGGLIEDETDELMKLLGI